MRAKYIEERYPRWFVFGVYGDGNVDVYDGEQDVATHVSKENAESMIAGHNTIIDALVEAVTDLSPEKQSEWLHTHARRAGG